MLYVGSYVENELLFEGIGDERDLHRVDRRQRQRSIRDRGRKTFYVIKIKVS